MDAQSYLMSLGWAGPGHPLHPSAYKQKGHRGLAYNPDEVRMSSLGNGLIKPILVSKKSNNLGVGRRAHEPQAGNEWWLKGFEKALGDIGKSESERSSGISTPVTGYEGKHAGLYGFFVKGQKIEGTLGKDDKVDAKSKKRKSDAISSDEESSSPEKPAGDFAAIASFMAVRDKDENKKHRRAKSTPQEEFAQAGQYFEVRDGTSKKHDSGDRRALQALENEKERSKKPKKKRKPAIVDETEKVEETKEERRERRRKRKEEKEARLKATSPDVVESGRSNGDDVLAKAKRKEERRRQKAETIVAVS